MFHVALIEQEMRRRGWEEAADMVVVRTDSYLRNQDAQVLQARDVFDGGADELAIHLGVVSRGEIVKTGGRQGVRIDYPKARKILRDRVKKKKPHEKIFNITENEFLRMWVTIFTFFGCLKTGR